MTFSAAKWLLLFQTFCVCIPCVYMVRMAGQRFGWIDHPSERKLHNRPVVTLGGLGVFAGLVISFLLFRVWVDAGSEESILGYREHAHLWLLFGCSLILVVVGAWDDLKDLNPFAKLAAQFLAAGLFVGLHVTSGKSWAFQDPTVPISVYLTNLLVFTCWIVLLVNAINLVDGLDGLAAGMVGIAAFWLMLANAPMENHFLTWVGAMLVGACAAFLLFNFHPASLFLGDTGALLLGLWVGAGSIEGDFKTISALILATPIVLLGIPLLEVGSSALRRAVGGKRVFTPDSRHMHHRLLKLGFRHRNIVLFYYGITVLLGMIGFLLAPEKIDAEGVPLNPRIAAPGAMYLLLCAIGGAVLLAYVALASIERKLDETTQQAASDSGE